MEKAVRNELCQEECCPHPPEVNAVLIDMQPVRLLYDIGSKDTTRVMVGYLDQSKVHEAVVGAIIHLRDLESVQTPPAGVGL